MNLTRREAFAFANLILVLLFIFKRSIDGGPSLNALLKKLNSPLQRIIFQGAKNPKVLYTVVVYVPRTHSNQIRVALAENFAGKLDEFYDSCSFTSSGYRRFRPLYGAHPVVGSINTIEIVEEERIETVVLKQYLKPVLAAVKLAHPYEQPYIIVSEVLNYEAILEDLSFL
jgi:hypothetical protein